MSKPKYNAVAYEKVFDTLGAKFWDSTLPDEIRFDFLTRFILWKKPNTPYKIAVAHAKTMMYSSYKEFDEGTTHDMRRFQKEYAHSATFMGWVRKT